MINKVLIFGTFDIIHPGHLFVIHEAKKYGELHAVVALDETVQRIKGRSPMHILDERLKQIEQYGVIAHPGDSHDRLRRFKELKPDIVLLGYDQQVFVTELKSYVESQALNTIVKGLPAFQPGLFKSSTIRKALDDPSSGFLAIDKPSGEPSFKTISGLRKIIGIRKIGFAGTLDPLASGLLICGIGGATALLDWFHLFPKIYEATANLGVVSDTYDSEGTIVQHSSAEPSNDEIKKTLEQFRGNLMQEPPMYSAKKFSGVRLYELARKGMTVKREKNEITIHALELISYHYPELRFRVTCSTGTYVRSLIDDIGKSLGTGAIMTSLRRTAIGDCLVENAVSISNVQRDQWKEKRMTVDDMRVRMCKLFFPEV